MRRPGVIAAAIVSIPLVACGGAEGRDAVTTTSSSPPSPAGSPSGSTSPEPEAERATAGSDASADGVQRFPDVVDAEAMREPDGTWTFAVTISSPYDTPERYADAWRVVGPDGTVLAERILLHDHAGEQPFTRSLGGVEIDPSIRAVTIEGRDRRYGYGGDTFTIELDRNDP